MIEWSHDLEPAATAARPTRMTENHAPAVIMTPATTTHWMEQPHATS